MSSTVRSLLLAALPALVAGWFVLFIAGVGTGVLTVQAIATGLMVALAFSGNFLPGGIGKNRWIPLTCVVGAATICALPLLFSGNGPKRWLSLGPIRLYVAPVVLPLTLVLSSHLFRLKAQDGTAAMTAIGLVLVLQQDFSQVLAFSVGFLLVLFNAPVSTTLRMVLTGLAVAACVAAYVQPDPLKPVPYVEGVFELAFRHSLFAGGGVLLGAFAFLGLLAKGLRRFNPGFVGIPAYFAVLYGCSVAGLTPAPLIGFGAGPLLGFGLLAAVASMDSGKLKMDNFSSQPAD